MALLLHEWKRRLSTAGSSERALSRDRVLLAAPIAMLAILVVLPAGCKLLRPMMPVERDHDVEHHLLKKIGLTSYSSAYPRKVFDHDLDEEVNLTFVPDNEKNDYVSRTVWFDPLGEEFRTIRQSYKKVRETLDTLERPKGGSTRTHTMSVKEMWEHRPGMWTVELYLDDRLARRLTFNVR